MVRWSDTRPPTPTVAFGLGGPPRRASPYGGDRLAFQNASHLSQLQPTVESLGWQRLGGAGNLAPTRLHERPCLRSENEYFDCGSQAVEIRVVLEGEPVP